MMITRLKIDVKRGASSFISRMLECDNFSVGFPEPSVISFAENLPTLHHERTDEWIGRCLSPSLWCQSFDDATHLRLVHRRGAAKVLSR